MAGITLDQAQALEHATELRIKFASMDSRGDLWGNAHEEYTTIFSELPTSWRMEELGRITTRTEHTRVALHLTNGQVDLLAVQHENGVELLLFGAASQLAVNSITGFVQWAWKRWHDLREGGWKKDSSFVVEVPRDVASGEVVPPIRLVVPPPVSDEEIARYLNTAMELSGGPN